MAHEALSGRLKCIPDGEPGKRHYFTRRQLDLLKYEPRILHEAINPGAPTTFTEEEANEVIQSIDKLETQYDDYALNSYEVFKKLRDARIVPQGVRFQGGSPNATQCRCVVYKKTVTEQSRTAL